MSDRDERPSGVVSDDAAQDDDVLADAHVQEDDVTGDGLGGGLGNTVDGGANDG